MPDGVRFSDPGEFEEQSCSVCGDTMDVIRNSTGATCFAGAMAGGKHPLHDSFYCPSREEMWHRQVCKLRFEAGQCPSKQIADIMIAEAALVLETRVATKRVSM